MIRSARLVLIGGAAALAALPALAQTDAAPADAAHMGHAAPADAVPANMADAHRQAMEKMHTAMMVESTGDADVDFARGMIPHHQGAIDMARIQIEFGDDPELRAMAEEVIRAQGAEIESLQTWLERNAPDVAAADAARMESLSANPATGAPPEPKPAGSEAPEAKPVAPSEAPEAKPAN